MTRVRSAPTTPLRVRLAVAMLGGLYAPVGIQALVLPRSFHDDFPFGRGWIAATGGRYDEHLTRDVGALFLALAVVSIWAWWRPAVVAPVAVAWLVQGLPHLGYHLGHLDHLEGVDRIGLLGSLLAVPVLATIALLPARRQEPTLAVPDGRRAG